MLYKKIKTQVKENYVTLVSIEAVRQIFRAAVPLFCRTHRSYPSTRKNYQLCRFLNKINTNHFVVLTQLKKERKNLKNLLFILKQCFLEFSGLLFSWVPDHH